jgi:hypothetical protein
MSRLKMTLMLCVLLAMPAALLIGAAPAGAARARSPLASHAPKLSCGAWSIAPSPNVPSIENFLNGVAALSPGNVWAVGNYGGINATAQTLIEHWNGKAWRILPSPNVGSGANTLNGVAAISADNVWAVGYGTSQGYSDSQTLVEHWNGTNWPIVASPNPPGAISAILSGITAISSSNVWAVGSYTSSGFVGQTLIEHWNGASWSVVSSPSPGSWSNNLAGVSVISAGNVWAVGSYQNFGGPLQTLVEQWNGTDWSMVPSPNSSGSNTNSLSGVAAVSPNDVWAVGNYVHYCELTRFQSNAD